jgi:hypothetical protein
MKKLSEKTSPEKENKKVNANKGAKDYKVREGENNSIYEEENNKKEYPYKSKEDNQYKTQPEFIDRDSDSKDKS